MLEANLPLFGGQGHANAVKIFFRWKAKKILLGGSLDPPPHAQVICLYQRPKEVPAENGFEKINAKKTKKERQKMEKEQFTYSVQSLLEEKDGHVSGPMSPTLFAKEMTKSAGFKYNRLARLWFADERINQCREDGGLTGHDTLLIGAVYSNDIWLSLWVDSGVGGMPVAMAYRSDNGEVEFTPVYGKASYARKLNRAEVQEIFKSVFTDPTQINIKKHTSKS